MGMDREGRKKWSHTHRIPLGYGIMFASFTGDVTDLIHADVILTWQLIVKKKVGASWNPELFWAWASKVGDYYRTRRRQQWRRRRRCCRPERRRGTGVWPRRCSPSKGGRPPQDRLGSTEEDGQGLGAPPASRKEMPERLSVPRKKRPR